MASSDYVVSGQGGFCPMGLLDTALTALPGDNIITITDFRSVTENDLQVGMAVMIGNEICRLQSSVLPDLLILRGCADTIPAPHAANSRVWFFSEAAITDEREYLATDEVGVKLSPFTAGSGPVPLDNTPPMAVAFNWRFVRPYAPGNVLVDGVPWSSIIHEPIDGESEYVITWAHRDRVTQADQLIGHMEGSIGPEAGVTYTARVYNSANVLVRTIDDITGTSLSYTYTLAASDIPTGVGRIVLSAVRDTFESWQSYTINLRGSPGGGFGMAFGYFGG